MTKRTPVDGFVEHVTAGHYTKLKQQEILLKQAKEHLSKELRDSTKH